MLQLWMTAMLRLSRLRVIDEIENGLVVLSRHISAGAAQGHGGYRNRTGIDRRRAAVLRMGSWIGGDRDGNPFVTAEALQEAVRRQSAAAAGTLFVRVHHLGAELSMSSRLVEPTTELRVLAARSQDASQHRQDEPYRQALVGIYMRAWRPL